jgi:hypothetical protein
LLWREEVIKESHQNAYRSVFLAHFDEGFGGSFNSKVFVFILPFSRSNPLIFGVGGTSSILDMFFELLLPSFTLLGNSDRRGVRAVATLLADLLIVARTSQDLFFAR